jgi:hypothetical protein
MVWQHFFRPLVTGSNHPQRTGAAVAASLLVVTTAACSSNSWNGRNDRHHPVAECAAVWWGWPWSGGGTAAPLPRPLRHRDPIWTLSKSQLRQRARDEAKLQTIVQELHQVFQSLQQSQLQQSLQHPLQQPLQQSLQRRSKEQDEALRSRIAQLQTEWLHTAYGTGVTLADRQQFLEQYGCTGYTDTVLDCIVQHGEWHKGIVEMGAGNGQWARAISDRWSERRLRERRETLIKKSYGPSHHAVLAYDDMSQLPLDPEVYHERTKVAHDHFGTVRPLLGGGGREGGGDGDDAIHHKTDDNGALAAEEDALRYTLQQWQCRERVLLLVYPPPGSDMAVQCARAYADLKQNDHTILYVGEGRGGATANDAFFDYLESSSTTTADGWWICQVLDVHPFGSKGYEKLYVLKKSKRAADRRYY